MSRKETIEQNYIFDAYAEVLITYEVFPTRTEECHGFHDFSEDEEVGRELYRLKIKLSDGEEIDVTDRLTEEEKKKILESEL